MSGTWLRTLRKQESLDLAPQRLKDIRVHHREHHFQLSLLLSAATASLIALHEGWSRSILDYAQAISVVGSLTTDKQQMCSEQNIRIVK